uniref:Putative secreted protein n=1 Tax=Ixodes ricinus TaxID=34613 RepID=A0A6B0UVP7_IXORI
MRRVAHHKGIARTQLPSTILVAEQEQRWVRQTPVPPYRTPQPDSRRKPEQTRDGHCNDSDPILCFMVTWRTAEARIPRPNKSAGARHMTQRHGSICVTSPNARPGGTGCRLLAESSAPKPINFGRMSTSATFPSTRLASTSGTVHEKTIL